ncbi:helix-turn-helix transcriptional regulator [Heyndrickxia sporothermodurans]|uniref:helix-turn-helix transcriptional regulator n=1 Tax=Heyndrickxia sporothermodurans TaxID=46224 RepID=UPI001FD022A5|nr:helix-turn-helix transcriptional regulator [Heyndrickxia sporothermodurans]
MEIKIVVLLGAWIKQSPYTREDIGVILKVSQNTISSWCNGKTYPSVPQLMKLCQLLNVKFEDIYKLREEES